MISKQERILIDCLLELREIAKSGSLEMSTIDETLNKFEVTPWKTGFNKYTLEVC